MSLYDLLQSQRRFIYLVIASVSAAGIWAAFRLPSAIYPELTFPRITVVAQGSALGPRQMMFGTTRPIEEAVAIIPGVRRVHSKSIRGASQTDITFAPATDMQYALQQVQARVNQVRSQLPSELDIEIERLTPSVFPILSYNVEGGDPATLYDLARYRIRPVISRVPGVGRVDVMGSDIREIEVVIDPARLAGLGLAYDDVAAAIRQATGVQAVGRVAAEYKQYLIVTDQEAHAPADIGDVIVATPAGTGVRVRDLGTVALGTEDRTLVIAGDGRPAALINVTRQIGGNSVAIADSVAAIVHALSPTLPPGVRLVPVYDQAALVRDAISSVRDAMLVGAALAVIVLLVFLGNIRITVVSALSIPLTLVITVFVMWLLGQTFNLMTLGAMAIGIGLVIDDAVVVTENIARHLALTPDRRVAIREAVQELIWPVTTSTITTVVVFLPLGLLEGVVGQFFIALSVTLAIAVLVSLVLALTVIPLLSEQYVTSAREGRVAAAVSGGMADWYARMLAHVLDRPRWPIAAVVVLLAAGVVVERHVGTGFLPEMDEGAFVLDYFTPGGTALDETDRQMRLVEHILATTPEITGTSRRTGAEFGLYATEQNTGDLLARLRPEGDRSRGIDAVIDEVRQRVSRSVPRLHIEFVQILTDVINDLAGAARPVEIKLFGERLDHLEAYAQSLMPALSKIDGLEDLYDGVSEPSAELLLKIDGMEAGRIGMTPEQVSADVSGSILGVTGGEVRSDDRAITVRVRAPDSVRLDPLRLGSLPIIGSGRRATPLSALATITPVTARAKLERENQQQMIVMTGDLSDRPLGAVVGDVQGVLASHPPPSDIRVELGGQYAGQRTAFRALLIVLALAGVSVVAVMVIQFASFVEPLIIVLAAPVSFVGALALLALSGAPLNVSSFMGLILLVGLIVKNGIILLDFANRRMRATEATLEVALRDAGRTRLRPILMTTMCTLFGLLPLALGLGAGSELQRPLALAVIGGLALSTPITLFIVPSLVVAVRGRGYRPGPAAARA